MDCGTSALTFLVVTYLFLQAELVLGFVTIKSNFILVVLLILFYLYYVL